MASIYNENQILISSYLFTRPNHNLSIAFSMTYVI